MMTSRIGRTRVLAALLLTAACGGGERVAEAAPPAEPVDSIRPADEVLARFRDGLPRVDTLSGGAPSLEALVSRFTAAVEARDSAALRAMALDRAEYAWIHFPSLQRLNPGMNNMRPDVMWMLLEEEGRKGMTRVMRRLGGGEARFGGWRCEDAPQVEGALRYWHACTVEVVAPDGSSAAMQLFGSVVEQDGRYKVVSWANDF